MKTVHKIVLKVLSVLMLVGGGSLLMMRINFTTYYDMVRLFKEYFWTPYGLVLGVVLIVLGFVGLLPVSAPKRIRNTISFSGTHGDVLIELDSVEANLGRVVSKMPEVKKIKVKVTPSEDSHRAVVHSDVLMYKGASGDSAREIANRIADHLMDVAVNILGVEEVTKVDLNVRDIIIDANQLLLAQARPSPVSPEPVAAAPIEAAAATPQEGPSEALISSQETPAPEAGRAGSWALENAGPAREQPDDTEDAASANQPLNEGKERFDPFEESPRDQPRPGTQA